MSKKTPDALRRSDRILVGALTVVLAAVSAAVGAAAAYRPHTEELKPVAQIVAQAAPVSAPVSLAGTATEAAYVPGRAKSPAEELVMNKLLAEHRCLSEALYYEARGEGEKGQKAIAEVIFSRMRKGNYGHSICAVVYEGAGQPACQFSFTCNGELKKHKQPGAWMRAQTLAAQILTGESQLRGATGGAVNFHATTVEPEWAAEMARTTQIGNHVFYKKEAAARSRAM
ncbi:spore germination cell wall hydrolase CwlJ-like protein [Rhizomicrobium palustre]|uniref:Spore germination cell wall hydrolase CwlJ-like protein n=1 Tax=Rhizomicrobium palustre TaxID=189966 RepID=A0A846N4L6_9PROT|nr:cell wall hydrolase [Rhizomicrobium palustre]NIK90141.1 spore germination cell wall hydrolase CwlJ-like protein [Rhizomicrobium palustre]